MTVTEIKCEKCEIIIGYTNAKISFGKSNYLFSDKLSENQKYAFLRKRRVVYCFTCYSDLKAKSTLGVAPL